MEWETGSTPSSLLHCMTTVFFPSTIESKRNYTQEFWWWWTSWRIILLCYKMQPKASNRVIQRQLSLICCILHEVWWAHHLSYVTISDSINHDTVAVHLFQRQFIQCLKKPSHLFYTSDGAASQYKNRKNFINLCHHEEDFGVAAEWHFSATSHGKGACDGVGGTVKRLAARASLQHPYDQITKPHQLFEWAVINIPATAFQNCWLYIWLQKNYKFEQELAMASVCIWPTAALNRQLLSFLSVILDVSPYCLPLCYPWLWSRWVWFNEGMALGPSTAYCKIC